MSLLLLASVKPHLKIDAVNDDAVLQAKLDAAEAFVSRRSGGFGALASSAATERVRGLRAALPLAYKPVISVTSVTDSNGSALTVGNLDVDTEQGLVNYSNLGNVMFPLPWYTVVYQTGYASAAAVPTELQEAVRLMTQHFYAPQRGGNRRGNSGAPGTDWDAYIRAQQIIDDFNSLASWA